MPALKVERIQGAYSQLRINGLTVTPTPSDLELALERMENMAAEWQSSSINAAYNFEDEPDPNSDLGVERAFWQCFETNLAIRLIPDFGKQVPPTLMALANASLSNLSARSAMNRIQQVPYPERQPRGSGNTHRYYRWNAYYKNTTSLPVNAQSNKMIYGDIDDFVEHFDEYLATNEVISSYSIVSDSGLEVVTDSNETPDINYRIKAVVPDGTRLGTDRQVTIIITTDLGRVETRPVFFSLENE